MSDVAIPAAAAPVAPASTPEDEKYQTGPLPQNTFKPLKAKAMVEALLKEQLAGVAYDPTGTTALTNTLAAAIKAELQTLNLPRYKYLVQVLIGEQRGAGIRFGARCLWDAKTDNMTEAVYMSDTLYCCAAVFAVYLY